MKTLTKRLIPVFIVVCVCLTMMVGLASNAANPDLSAYTKIEMYDSEAVASVSDPNAWIIWCPDVGGDIISTFTVEEGKQLNGFAFDCMPVSTTFDLKIYSVPDAANCTWEDDQTAFKAAYATASAGTPVFEALNQTCEDANPAFQTQSDENAWNLTYGMKSYKFDEPLPAGTYAYAFTMKVANMCPVATKSLSDASGVVYYKQSNGDIARTVAPISHRTSYYISDVPATTPATTPAATDDFYYWDYEETLNDVGGRLNLVSKVATGPDISEVDAVYVDGVIDNTSAIDLVSNRHAESSATLTKTLTGLTFATWAYLPSDYSRTTFSTIMSIGSRDVASSFVHVYLEQTSTGFNLAASIGDVDILLGTLDADEWAHVAITYDVTTKTLKAYINGVCTKTEVVSTTQFTGILSNAPLYIGHQKYQWLFTGTIIDESVFAPSVWSADQIKDLYDDPAAAAASMKEILDPAPATTAPATTAPATNAPSGTNPGTGDMSIFLVLGAMIVMLTSVLTIVSVSKKKNY